MPELLEETAVEEFRLLGEALLNMGFDIEEVLNKLRVSFGDVNKALGVCDFIEHAQEIVQARRDIDERMRDLDG